MSTETNPVHTLLTNDAKVVLEAIGVLSRIWRLLLVDLSIKPMRWDYALDEYCEDAKSKLSAKVAANIKGNVGKGLRRDDMSWNVLCRGVSILKLTSPKLVIKIKEKEVTKTITIDVPYTMEENRGDLLAKAWKEIKGHFPEKDNEWCALMKAYSDKQKKLGKDLRNSLRSNLTSVLKTDCIMWNVLHKAIEVHNYEAVTISLDFKLGKNKKSIAIEI